MDEPGLDEEGVRQRSDLPESREPDLLCSATVIVTSPDAGPTRPRGLWVGAASVTIHLVVLGAALLVPLLAPGSLPEPTQTVRAFLVAPPELPPAPPPPPPAPAVAPASAPRLQPEPRLSSVATALRVPMELPEAIEPDELLELGVPGGIAGGVPGGVEGGIAGGIVGGLVGLPEARPPEPVRVGGDILEPRKLKHVSPEYPFAALQARLEGNVVLECTIDPQGRVQEVKILRALPMLDKAAVRAVRQWVYSPTLVQGVPVPIIMTVTVRFSVA
jgi:protein TonB